MSLLERKWLSTFQIIQNVSSGVAYVYPFVYWIYFCLYFFCTDHHRLTLHIYTYSVYLCCAILYLYYTVYLHSYCIIACCNVCKLFGFLLWNILCKSLSRACFTCFPAAHLMQMSGSLSGFSRAWWQADHLNQVCCSTETWISFRGILLLNISQSWKLKKNLIRLGK